MSEYTMTRTAKDHGNFVTLIKEMTRADFVLSLAHDRSLGRYQFLLMTSRHTQNTGK